MTPQEAVEFLSRSIARHEERGLGKYTRKKRQLRKVIEEQQREIEHYKMVADNAFRDGREEGNRETYLSYVGEVNKFQDEVERLKEKIICYRCGEEGFKSKTCHHCGEWS